MNSALHIEIREAQEAENLLRLVQHAGWNQKAGDCNKMVGHPDASCIYACDGDKVVGSAAVQLYGGRKMAFINMVVVLEEYRKRGIATMMLRHIMEHYKDCDTLRLYASQAGSYVYSKLGFVPSTNMNMYKYFAPEKVFHISDDVQPLHADDLPAAAELDAVSFGLNRQSVLAYFYNLAPSLCFKIVRKDGSLSGFVIGREGPYARQASAVTAANEDDAVKLLAAVSGAGGNSVKSLMIVPNLQVNLIRKLESLGFERNTPLILMDYGKPGPVLSANYYGMLGGDFG